MMEGITLRDYERAEGELQTREGRISFYVHATIYVLVNLLLIIINLMFVPDFLWFFLPLVGWGIGLTMHYLFAVRFAQREIQNWQVRVEHRAREIHAQQASGT